MYKHYSDPALSLWQSILAERARQPAAGATRRDPMVAIPGAMLSVVSDKLAATEIAVIPREQENTKSVTPQKLFRETVGGNVVRCAEFYARRVRALAFGPPEELKRLDAELERFGNCDTGWKEAWTEFVSHYAVMRHADVPYRSWTNLDDHLLPLADKVRIGVIGDWGTGEKRAQRLLESVKDHGIDMLIHLGDIYYAGTKSEADRFRERIRSVLPATPVFTLCGNHDMYSGAEAYCGLIEELGQPGSFFGLRNANWQLLALDTGYNDYNPAKVSTGATWLRDDAGTDGVESEVDWHVDKLANPGGRRTILLSHHPLFSRLFAIEGRTINERLHGQLAPWIGNVDLWLWGHEHVQAIYDQFADLRRGRCIGASAIPNAAEPGLYIDDPRLENEAKPTLLGGVDGRLALDPASELYELGFAVLALDGTDGQAAYYAWGETRGARLMWKDTLDAPTA